MQRRQALENARRTWLNQVEAVIAGMRPKRGLGALAADKWERLVELRVRDVWGRLPHVRYSRMGVALDVDSVRKTMHVRTEDDGGPVQGDQSLNREVGFGFGTAAVGKQYRVDFPYHLPDDPKSLLTGPEPYGRPWAKVPAGKWLYYTGYNTSGPTSLAQVCRIPWPPQSGDRAEVLYDPAVKGAPAGFSYTDMLIGVDGNGVCWFRYRMPVGWAAGAVDGGGLGNGVGSTITGAAKPVAVDCTPGHSNLVSWQQITDPRSWVESTHFIASNNLASFLHLQDDGGTTYAAGNVVWGSDAWGSIAGTAIAGWSEPSFHTPHGEPLTGPAHYVPPNDGSFSFVHYHWYELIGVPVPVDPPPQTVHDTPLTALRVRLGKVVTGSTGRVDVGWATAYDILQDQEMQIVTWGIMADGTPVWPENVASLEALRSWIISGGSWETRPLSPFAYLTRGWSYVRPYTALPGTYRPHVWTAQGDEFGGVGNTVVAFPSIAHSQPGNWLGPLDRLHPTNRDSTRIPPAPLACGPVPLMPVRQKYGRAVWSVGPDSSGRINHVTTWDTTAMLEFTSFHSTPSHYFQAGGDGGQLAGLAFARMIADGRDGLDLLAQDVSNRYWFSVDGGENWQAAPWSSPPCGTGFGFYGLGYIVDLA